MNTFSFPLKLFAFHVEPIFVEPSQLVRTNLVCNWPKNDSQFDWHSVEQWYNNLQEVNAEALRSPGGPKNNENVAKNC